MNPQERQEFEQLKVEFAELKEKFDKLSGKSDHYLFEKEIALSEGRSIVAYDGEKIVKANSTGIIIGEGTSKLGFYGTTPVAQQTAPSLPSGGSVIDVQARAWITAFHNDITNLGLLTP